MRARRAALAPVVPLALVATLAFGATFALPGDPAHLALDGAFAGPSAAHPFGRGEAGIDVLLLVAHASARALGLAAVVATLAFAVGAPLGTIAGLAGGRAREALARVCDLVQAFPSFLLALAVLSAVRVPSRAHVGAVFLVSAWAPFARLSLAQAAVLGESSFVDAARALGATRARVVVRHVLPNLLGPVAVQLGTSAAGVVLGETALGFVGLGPRDGVSLGGLLDQGSIAMLRAPHVLVVGALAVALVSGSLQLATEALRARFGHPRADAG